MSRGAIAVAVLVGVLLAGRVASGGDAGAGGGSGGGAATGANQRLGKQMAAEQYGWTGAQWPCLRKLWDGESDWNANAVNESSGAYGIPQALPSAHGHPYRLGDAKAQIAWGLDYIDDRYDTPCAAWSAWQSRDPHWY